jgi:hypothetical protein
MTRRDFAALLSVAGTARSQSTLDITDVPNFCSHEHWGSVASIGTIPGGYRCDYEQGATPHVATGLFDLLIDPYMRGHLLNAGVDRARLERGAGWEWFRSVMLLLRPQLFTGIFPCTRRGIELLYGIDILKLNADRLGRLESAIAENYRRLSDWHRSAMKQASFRGLIRPVHPEFYRQQESEQTAAAEARLMRTVMRIDPFLEFTTGPPERRKRMVELANIEPADASSWRSFLDYWFDQAVRGSAVGIKQLQAYRRNLEFPVRRDDEIRWSDTSESETRKRQDWIVQESCRRAHERGWAHQVHVGTHNLPHSSPMPLAALARRYTRMKVVMIHCWPFLEEAGTLARQVANIYIDTCWQPILNPQFYRTAMSQWWNYVPTHKITCGHDATTVEMAAGSSLYTRAILVDVLREQTRHGGFSVRQIRKAAQQVLHDNAAELYG